MYKLVKMLDESCPGFEGAKGMLKWVKVVVEFLLPNEVRPSGREKNLHKKFALLGKKKNPPQSHFSISLKNQLCCFIEGWTEFVTKTHVHIIFHDIFKKFTAT
jgi:hypothetical protein